MRSIYLFKTSDIIIIHIHLNFYVCTSNYYKQENKMRERERNREL